MNKHKNQSSQLRPLDTKIVTNQILGIQQQGSSIQQNQGPQLTTFERVMESSVRSSPNKSFNLKNDPNQIWSPQNQANRDSKRIEIEEDEKLDNIFNSILDREGSKSFKKAGYNLSNYQKQSQYSGINNQLNTISDLQSQQQTTNNQNNQLMPKYSVNLLSSANQPSDLSQNSSNRQSIISNNNQNNVYKNYTSSFRNQNQKILNDSHVQSKPNSKTSLGDEFDQLLQESLDRRETGKEISNLKNVSNHSQGRNSMGSSTQNKQDQNRNNIPTILPKISEDSDKMLDDLVNEIQEESPLKQNRQQMMNPDHQYPIYYNKQSIQIYKKNSDIHKSLSLKKAQQENDILNQFQSGSQLNQILNSLLQKYSKLSSPNQEELDKIYSNRLYSLVPYQIQIKRNSTTASTQQNEIKMFNNESHKVGKAILQKYRVLRTQDQHYEQQIQCLLQGIPVDGRLVAVTNSDSNSLPYLYGNYQRMHFKEGETLIIISASVENSYMLFGFKETEDTMNRKVSLVDVYAFESTSVTPQFQVYPHGIRRYKIQNWDELGFDSSSGSFLMDINMNGELLTFDSYVQLEQGEIPIIQELYLAIKDFNANDEEELINSELKDAFKLLSFKTGDVILMTVAPNKGGWFEGYRGNDPDCVCGISHKDFIKKINFK